MSDSKRTTIEVFILIDEDGNYVISTDRDQLHEQWQEDVGDVPVISRVLTLALDVELPRPSILSAAVDISNLEAVMKVAG